MSNNEATPLLRAESTRENGEEQVDQQSWLRKQFNAQTFSGISILWCIFIYGAGYFVSVYMNQRSYYYSDLPPELEIQLAIAAQLWFWTILVSFLNYARLRRSGIDLPWWLNLIVDVVVLFTGFFISLLYFAVNASLGCRERYRYDPPNKECKAGEIYVRSIGTIVMVGVLFLSLTHGVLLVIRLRRLPTLVSVPGVIQNPSAWREGGWFIGIGRGPLYLRTAPALLEEERNFDQSA